MLLYILETKPKCEFTVLMVCCFCFDPAPRSACVSVKDPTGHKSHPSGNGLEWDSYPFSDGDWGPTTRQVSLSPCCIFRLYISCICVCVCVTGISR